MGILNAVKMRLLRYRAERGEVEAMTCLGVEHLHENNFEEATRWFRNAAERGSADVQLQLGARYDNGEGVRKDEVEAVRWYRLAAEQGNTAAQHALGSMYLLGTGVAKDIPEGIGWYRKVAEQGDIDTQILLGGLYASSEFIPNDNAEAVFWYSAAFKASSLTRSMAKKYTTELQWFLSAAEVGDGDVLLNVANIYSSRGGGVPQDNTEALRWYLMAADRGNDNAMLALGHIYEAGDGVAQDFPAAMRWYQLAAEAGNAGAMFNIGMMYVRSEGVTLDKHELGFWFCLCSTSSLPPAQENFVQQVLTTKFAPESLIEIRERAQRWIETHPKIHFHPDGSTPITRLGTNELGRDRQ